MRMALAVLLLSGCTSSLLGPDDPAFEELCVHYVAPGEPAYVTRSMFEQCETLAIYVVEFP